VVEQASAPTAVVLNGEALAKEQEEQIGSVAALLELPRTVASILLRRYKWDTERLNESYFDAPQRVLEQAGVSSVKRQRSGGSDAEPSATVGACAVCMEDMTRDESTAFSCGHRFCNDCWTGHMCVQINDGNAQAIRCMAEGCTVLAEPALVQALVDATTFSKFARFAQKQFVDDNPYLRWCPGAGCSNAVKVTELGGAHEVECTCGMVFCFKCSRETHFPLSCERLSRWEDKCRNDSATGQWMVSNTKRCRKCFAQIEKNGGCNWIHCRCGAQFCYFCFSTEHSHHGQPCNAPPDSNVQSAQSELEYYMHYFDRYDGHRKSQELETKLRGAALEKMEALVTSAQGSMQHMEVDYLREATETLICCRRILKNTYPYAFYLAKGAEKNLFENLQARLESVTEALSALLEADEPKKSDILNTSAHARTRLSHLREGLEEGLLASASAATPAAGASGSSADPICLE